ncbi:hypothetical protein E4H12_15000 [Candidatus Thorarchaeota archaeon]|nr:MAG: hypothetical protein E4H12_15000 [Candidatus Thorarchaeota archaeon]
MLRAIAVVFVIVFFLYWIGEGNLVERAVNFTKEQAEYTDKHGAQGLFEKLWCGAGGCKKDQSTPTEEKP